MDEKQRAKLRELEVIFGALSALRYQLWDCFKISIFFYACKGLEFDAIVGQLHLELPKYPKDEISTTVRAVIRDFMPILLSKRKITSGQVAFEPTPLGRKLFKLIKEYTGLS
ncbi:TPA: hypothetical protein H1005_00085 [archaeon]|uniref:Uncharacterized protein n=1 Tax=Candidatus Naiadarchaeum limnaeum TaxID=2756139 RepID=A0A832V2L3_9ARCH|nr:hypothetical protein [Candidatus Naiadarchaeales archaeon SRR2090153.bin1042]HIK00868.1 hypothetical protein [Candidatus Naiadarchaeum limnaeum]